MNKLIQVSTVEEMITYRDSLSAALKIGFVPTMGALHEGHASLIKKSVSENDITILSIFVNPTQFNNPEDLKKYPRTMENDLKLAEVCGASAVFTPEFSAMYPDNYKYQVSENDFSKKLCGEFRKNHFEGVLTIVMKLFNIVRPHRAYFGEKDQQQLVLIKDMVDAFFIKTQIIACPTLREQDGLALSSRNIRLTKEGRSKAPLIYKTLLNFSDETAAKSFLEEKNIDLEYFEEYGSRRYIAAYIDGVRLIDNVSI